MPTEDSADAVEMVAIVRVPGVCDLTMDLRHVMQC